MATSSSQEKSTISMVKAMIPTPPQTPPCPTSYLEPEPVPELSLERLDNLLETYLELLDEYSTLRKQLSKQLSEGFFSLARANHLSGGLGNGRRYGEGGYDERMKAQRRIIYPMDVSSDSHGGSKTRSKGTDASYEVQKKHPTTAQQAYSVSIQKTNDVARPEQSSTRDSEQPNGVEGLEHSSTRGSAAVPASSSSPILKKSSLEPKKDMKLPPSNRDPMNWYGILTPPSLREAQKSFVSAIETSIPQLLSTSTSMYELEYRITKLRTQLGLQPEPQAGHHAEERLPALEENISVRNSASRPSKKFTERLTTSE